MKRLVLTAAAMLAALASVAPGEAAVRSGSLVRGFRAPLSRAPALLRAPAVARPPAPFAVQQPNLLHPGNLLGLGPRPSAFDGRARLEPFAGRERWRRWRGLPIYAATIGSGYPYPYAGGNDPAAEGPYGAPLPPPNYSERYSSNVAVVPMQPQTQFNPGPRIIYVNDPRPEVRPAPGPRVIYGIHPGRPNF